MAQISNAQAVEWLNRISQNLHEFRKKPRMKVSEKQKFLNQQYYLLHLMVRAIEGKVKFVGVPPLKPQEDLSAK